MKHKNTFALLICVALLLALLAGCSPPAEQDATILGRVKSIDGNKITLTVMPNRGNMQGGPPQGADGQAPPSGGQRPDGQTPPSGGQMPDGQAPPSGGQMPDGQRPDGQMQGEEKTITLTDKTTIKIQSNGSETPGSISDIAAGDMLNITMSQNTPAQIQVLKGGGEGRGEQSPKGVNPSPSADPNASPNSST